jgi:hypothetical protein
MCSRDPLTRRLNNSEKQETVAAIANAANNGKAIRSIEPRFEGSAFMQTFQTRCSGSISHFGSIVGSRLGGQWLVSLIS